MSLRRFSRRALLSRPGRTLLTLASIVIGVAAVMAVTIITASTRESNKGLFEAITGKAALEVTSVSGKPMSDELLAKVAAVPDVQAALPLVQTLCQMTVGEDTRVRLQLLGIDTARDHLLRELEIVSGRMLKADDGDRMLLEADFAEQLNIKPGDKLRFLSPKRLKGDQPGSQTAEVVGLVRVGEGGSLTQAGLVFMPIKRAQSRFVGKGKLSAIQVLPAKDMVVADLQTRIQGALSDAEKVQPPQGSADVLQNTLLATEQGLKLGTGFSLILAGFIILNTFLMTVGERRRQLAIVRAIGGTRWQVGGMLLREGLVLGVIGIVLGIGFGLLLAWGGQQVLSRSMEVTLPPFEQFAKSPIPYILASSFGFIVVMIAVLLPAARASKVSPLEGLARVAKGDMETVPTRYIAVGIAAVTISSFIIFCGTKGWVSADVATGGGFGLLLGLVLLVPLVLAPGSTLIASLFPKRFGVEGSLALKQILRHRGRTSLTVGVLFVAGSTGTGLAHSILDSIHNVKNWYRQTFPGDYYVRSLLPDMGSGQSADLPEGLDLELAKIPGIAYLDRVKTLECQVNRKDPLKDAAGEPVSDLNVVLLTREFNEPGRLPLELVAGDADQVREQMARGEVVVGNMLAFRLKLKVGDEVEVGTDQGRQAKRVCAINNEYFVGGLVLYMDWNVSHRDLGIEGVDAFIIRSAPGQAPQLRSRLAELCKQHSVLMHSRTEIGARVDRIVAGSAVGLWLLLVVEFVVAAFGLVNTLSMNVLEQTRELGLLRIVAMTRGQVRRTILAQALIIGLVGLVPGVISGLGIALILNLAMEPSNGRAIEFQLHPVMMALTFVSALAITVLAAFIPAFRASRVNVVEALHYE